MYLRALLVPCLLCFTLATAAAGPAAASPPALSPADVFELQWAGDPQVSPDGREIAYVRYRGDVMKDTFAGDLWLVSADGREHRPLVSKASSPRWSPDGTRLLYVAAGDGGTQIFVRWLDTGTTAQVTRVQRPPSHVTWSPDGRSIAFVMPVAVETEPLAKPLAKPEGAEWAAPPKVIEKLIYRADGEGFLPDTRNHVFVVSALGGTPRTGAQVRERNARLGASSRCAVAATGAPAAPEKHQRADNGGDGECIEQQRHLMHLARSPRGT